MQKQQYLQGFLQKSLENVKKTQVSAVFTSFAAKSVQKHQYLQGFRQKTVKNNNIYKVFCKKRAQTAIFTRLSAKTVQKQQ